MNRKVVLLAFVFVFLSLAIFRTGLISPVGASPQTWYVPIDFPTIQSAINNASVSDGDTIFVYNGTYYENVVANKSVTIIGQDPAITIVDGNGTGTVFHVVVDNVSISNFTIQNSGHSEAGIFIDHSENCNVTQNYPINNRGHGILMLNSAGAKIQGNNITRNDWDGLWVEWCENVTIRGNIMNHNGGQGILMLNSTYPEIQGNEAKNNVYCGMKLEESTGRTINGNNVTDNEEAGLWLDSCGSSIIGGNNASNNNWMGVGLYLSPNCTVTGNNAANNYGEGIWLSSSENCTLNNNTVSSNGGHGVWLEFSNQCTISENRLSNNSYSGIRTYKSAKSEIARNNVTFNSEHGVYLDYSVAANISENIIRGNAFFGIGLWMSGNSWLTRNVGENNGDDCFYLDHSPNSRIIENMAINNTNEIALGLLMTWCENSVLSDNLIMENGDAGMIIYESKNSTIFRNTVKGNGILTTVRKNGILLSECSNSRIAANKIAENGNHGIEITHSDNCSITYNEIAGNHENGIYLDHSEDSNITQNEVVNNGGSGMELYESWNSQINQNNVSHNADRGIGLEECRKALINNNTIINNAWHGIFLDYSPYSKLIKNNIENNRVGGIWIKHSMQSEILGNIVNQIAGSAGVWLELSDSSLLDNNMICNNAMLPWANGIWMKYCSNCSVTRNKIVNNTNSMYVYFSNNNLIYHNSFINNTGGVSVLESHENVWDDGYPSGGNYWSHYTDTDLYRGPDQNETGSDGIWDHPYIIDADNIDYYPLTKGWYGPHDIGIRKVIPSKTIVEPGDSLNITVTVVNYGIHTENFNLTVYADQDTTIIGDEITIGTQNITLIYRNSTTITFTWNTTGSAIGRYTISAIVTVVPDEIDTTDNTLINGIVTVSTGVHDVAVINVTPTKTIVSQGYNNTIYVTVENQGDFEENFNVTAYADLDTTIVGDEITIGTQNVTLPSENATTVTFTWNTTGVAKGNYTISAYAWPVVGETDTTDNTLTDGTVQIVIPGDVNADGTCNMKDIYQLILHFMCSQGQPCYVANCDINCDGTINMKDIYTAIKHYGETHP